MLRYLLVFVTATGSLSAIAWSARPEHELFEGVWLVIVFAVSSAVFVVTAVVLVILKRDRVNTRYVAVLFAVNAACLIASATWVPLSVRVLVSDAELRQYAENVLHRSGTNIHPLQRRVGSFHVRGAGNHDGAVYVSTGSDGMFGDAGLIYVPRRGAPPMWPHAIVQCDHLYGPWWRYSIQGD